MRIQEVQDAVGVTKKNIRFYEEEGLLKPRRSSDNGYRDYDAADIETLLRVKFLRSLGVPIGEIKRLQWCDVDMITMSDVKNNGRRQLDHLNKQQQTDAIVSAMRTGVS